MVYMKILKFLTLGILAVSLTACGVAGPKGEKGDQGVPGQTGPQGPAGQDGSDGQDGKDGIDGLPGTDGATWLTGEQDPTDSDGENGDLYLNTLTFDIFLKSNGAWSKIANIKGKDGTDGVDGQDGKDGKDGLPGTDGATWLTGLEDPTCEDGENGDLYLNTTSSDIFTKVNGEWTKIGNIKGNPGENGHDADTYGRVHTVTFDPGNGILLNYASTIQVKYGETIELPVAEQDGFVFSGWYTGFGINDGKFTNTTPVTRDLILYAYYESIVNTSHVVRFILDGKVVEEINAPHLSTISKPSEEKTVGYTVNGWYTDNNTFVEAWNFLGCVVSNDINLYANFVPNEYSISFVDEMYSYSYDPITVFYNKNYSLPFVSQIDDAVFCGWVDEDGHAWDISGVFNCLNDVILYASWESALNMMTNIDRILNTFADPELYLRHLEDNRIEGCISDEDIDFFINIAEQAVTDSQTQYDKIHSIYKLVADNMFYDDYMLHVLGYGELVGIKEHWTQKRGICNDYSYISKQLLKSIGIPCTVIEAYGAHNYNAAYDSENDRWIYFDTTWGSHNQFNTQQQYIYGGYDDSWFDVDFNKLVLEGDGYYHLPKSIEILTNNFNYVLCTGMTFDPNPYSDWFASINAYYGNEKELTIEGGFVFEDIICDSIGNLEFDSYYGFGGVEKLVVEGTIKKFNGILFHESEDTIEEIIFKDGTEYIGFYQSMKKLLKVSLPSSLKKMSTSFFACSNLSYVVYGGTINQWMNIEKDNFWYIGTNIKSIVCIDGIVNL